MQLLGMGQGRRNFGKLLATGQITSYGSGTGVDDGAYRKGIVKAYTVLTAGQYSGTTNITINSKTDAHSNACVFDNNTGLMWSRTVAASVGPASDGLLPWTTNVNGEGIFPYVVAANAANLGGYSDWRIPNIFELYSLATGEQPTGTPNSTAFPSWPSSITVFIWSSTTDPWTGQTTTALVYISGDAGIGRQQAKTAKWYCPLVRG